MSFLADLSGTDGAIAGSIVTLAVGLLEVARRVWPRRTDTFTNSDRALLREMTLSHARLSRSLAQIALAHERWLMRQENAEALAKARHEELLRMIENHGA